MRTSGRHAKPLLALTFLLSLFSIGFPAFAETTGMTEQHAQAGDDWPGLYFGFMPCADCNGVKTTLALNKNKSYVLISQYVGKSDREFVERGKFSWTEKNNTILLTPRKGSTPHQYFAGENILIQLDKDGNRFTGKNADRYILRRKDVTDAVSPHSSH